MPVTPTVAVSGYAALDYAMRTDPFAGSDRTTIVRDRLSAPWPGRGGVAHLARALTASGVRTEVISWVGPDAEGRAYMADLAAEGVGTTGVAQVGSRTPAAYLFYDDDGRTRCFYDPGDGAVDRLTEAQRAVVDRADWLCVAVGPRRVTAELLRRFPSERPLAWAVKADTDAFPAPLVRALLERARVASCSRHERSLLVAAADADDPYAVCPEDTLVIETRGADGVWFRVGGTEWLVATEPVGDTDTTGAGDSFLAGVLTHLVSSPKDAAGAVDAGIAAARDLLLARRRKAEHG